MSGGKVGRVEGKQRERGESRGSAEKEVGEARENEWRESIENEKSEGKSGEEK